MTDQDPADRQDRGYRFDVTVSGDPWTEDPNVDTQLWVDDVTPDQALFVARQNVKWQVWRAVVVTDLTLQRTLLDIWSIVPGVVEENRVL
jgi:hypothetical protein